MLEESETLPMPSPRLSVTEAEVLSVVKGMEPGPYRTRDIYPRYETWARREGKRVATRQTLGLTLQRMTERLSGSHGHVSVWIITPEMVV